MSLVFLGALASGRVHISEVHYHPPDPDGKLLEFIELANDGASPVSLGGWRLAGSIEFVFPEQAAVPPGGRIVVARNREYLRGRFTLDRSRVFGDFEGALDNSGDRVVLFDARGAFADGLTFDDGAPWPDSADGGGPSLQRLCLSAPAREPSNWAAEPPTPGAAGARSVCPPPARPVPDVVIHEIHYHPARDRDDLEEFVELFNRSDQPVALDGWRFLGIDYRFPAGTTLPAGGTIAVCRNAAYIQSAFGIENAVGDFTGVLSNAGERIALLDARGVLVDVVRYSDQDEWPHAADGEGRSLEKIVPDADGYDPASWSPGLLRAETFDAEPDGFASASVVGMLPDLLAQRLLLGIHGAGEFIVDDVVLENLEQPGTNLIANGGFEAGDTGWSARGSAAGSTVESGIGVGGSAALRLVTTSSCGEDCESCASGDTVSLTLFSADLDLEAMHRLSFRYRYVQGAPGVFCRILRGTAICIGERLVSPGRPNSSSDTVLPPFISHGGRFPRKPHPGDPVWISAQVRAPSGQRLDTVELRYAAGDEQPSTVPMFDDGAHGDGEPADGVYGAELPPFSHNTVVLYRVVARTTDGRFALAPPTVRSHLFERRDLWGFYVDGNQPESMLPVYHVLLPAVDAADPRAINNFLTCFRLATCDFAFEGEVYPEVGIRFRGNTACVLEKRNLKLRFLRGREFRGLKKLNLQGIWTDKSLVREHLAWDFVRQMGIPYCETEYARVHLNGEYHGLFLLLEHPDERFLERNGLDPNGCLFKARQPPNVSPTPIGVAVQPRAEDYPRFWEEETCEDGDLTSVATFIGDLHADARSVSGPSAEFFLANMFPEDLIGYQLVQSVLNNIDSFAKNHFLYEDRRSGLWSFLCWDMDLVFGKYFSIEVRPVGTLNDCMLSPGNDLNPWFTTTVLQNRQLNHLMDFFFNAGGDYFRRAYLVRLWDILQEKYTNQVYDPVLDELEAFLAAEEAEDFARWGRSSVNCGVNCATICASGQRMAENIAEVKRQLRLHRDFLIRYIERWHPEVVDHDRMKVIELMYRPDSADASLEYIELLNTGQRAVDLSDWAIAGGVRFVFPRGAVVPEGGLVLVVKSLAAFTARYPQVSATAQIFGDYSGTLGDGGDEIRLYDAGPGHPATVDLVRYADGGDWPEVGPGFSIELTKVAPSRDNDWGAHWRASSGTPGSTVRRFLRGDVIEDGEINLTDAVRILSFLFLGETPPLCLDAADVDDDSNVVLADAIYTLNFLFRGGSPPPPPYPDPGTDPTADTIECH